MPQSDRSVFQKYAAVALQLYASEGAFELSMLPVETEPTVAAFEGLGCAVERLPGGRLRITPPADGGTA